MTHRAETIMQTVVTTVTGLTTTGSRVYRGRAYDLPATDANALCVYQGEDRNESDLLTGKVISRMTFVIEAKAREATTQIDTTLNKIREEVTVALATDYTLGLSFVERCEELGAEEPELSGDGDRPIGSMALLWAVRYRRSLTNPAS